MAFPRTKGPGAKLASPWALLRRPAWGFNLCHRPCLGCFKAGGGRKRTQSGTRVDGFCSPPILEGRRSIASRQASGLRKQAVPSRVSGSIPTQGEANEVGGNSLLTQAARLKRPSPTRCFAATSPCGEVHNPHLRWVYYLLPPALRRAARQPYCSGHYPRPSWGTFSPAPAYCM